jgi:hypothetical protein
MNGYAGEEIEYTVTFPASKAGLSTVGFVFKSSGVAIGSRSIVGVFENGYGSYGVKHTHSAPFSGIIEWDTGDSDVKRAREDVNVTSPLGLASGSGSIPVTISVLSDEKPLDNVSIYVTTDIYGLNVVAGTLYTDSFGNATMQLDPGVYYVWKQLAGINFTNPEQITVA